MPSGHSIRWYRALCWLICALMIVPAAVVQQSVRAQQSACVTESEPNNVEAEAEEHAGEFCLSGTLPESADQELIVWTVSEDDAKFSWTMRLDGIEQTSTGAKIYALASEPGVRPIVAGSLLLDLTAPPETVGAIEHTFLVSPGEYLVGLSRSDRADFLPPPDTGYELALQHADRLPKRLDKEPNDDDTTATPIEGSVSLAGDLSDSIDTFAWTVTDEGSDSGWGMHLDSAIGSFPSIYIRDSDSNQLLYVSADLQSQIDLYDLAFPPGTYSIEIRPPMDRPTPYILTIEPGDRPVGDIEPNNEQQFASVLDPANPVVTGRLAATDDIDLYRLVVDDKLAGSLLDMKVLTRSQLNRRICLTSVELGTDLKCAEGPGGAAITNLLLPRGDYIVRVSGETDPEDKYILRFDLTTPPAADFEAEPNDDLGFATTLDPTIPIRGQFDTGDYDMFRVTVSGEPQLWDVAANGTGILDFDYVRRDGTELMTSTIAVDFTAAQMSDLYLTPGDHWIRIRGDAGEYTITMTALGPPPPDGEHETNNTALTAEPMLIGGRKTGRLVDTADLDTYRFSLAAREHVSVTIDSPDDAMIQARVDWGNTRVADGVGGTPGEDIAFDLILEPGDYVITLFANQVSTDRYSLDLARLDPFVVTDDQEPNDTFATAQSISPGQTVSGSLGTSDALDMYAIAAGSDRDLTFPLVGDGIFPSLTDDQGNYYSIVLNSDGTAYELDQRVSDEVPLFLQLTWKWPVHDHVRSARCEARRRTSSTGIL